MNPARRESVFNNLSGTQHKVFNAVPISEHWQCTKVLAELYRVGIQIDGRSLRRVLSELHSMGLIHMDARADTFWRDPERPRLVLTQQPSADNHHETEEEPVMSQQPETPDLLTEFGSLATKLRADAAALLDRADRIEALALRAAEEIKAAGSAGEELAALRRTLKGLMGGA